MRESKRKAKSSKPRLKAQNIKTVIYRARIINPISPIRFEEFRDGALVVDSHGRILALADYSEYQRNHGQRCDRAKVIDKRGYVIIPGLVDCHLHLPQLDQRGKHGATLLDWLNRYIFPAEAAFSSTKVVDDVVKRFFKKLILNGTTTAAIYTTIHAKATDHAFKNAQKSGIRAIIGKVMMDQYAPPELREETHQSLKDSEKLCAKWHGAANGRLMYAFTPRFAPTCSEELLMEAGNLARESGAYIQTHIAETLAENARVKELFPGYKDYTDVYEDNGLLTPKTILGHGIYLSMDEMGRIARAKAKVAHCPTSNFFLKSGRMPVDLIEEHGITYGLGTDVGAGTSMSLFTTMRHADYIQQHLAVTPTKAFYLATLGGAKTLSLEHETGNLKPDKSADFCVVDICKIDPYYRLSDLSADEILSLLMYRGDGRVVREVWGSGLDIGQYVC